MPPDSPLFDGYHPVDPGSEFTNSDGSLIYPDDSLPSKPYAVPGTIDLQALPSSGTVMSRWGSEYGGWLTTEGTPFANLSLPPDGALKPFYQYEAVNPAELPRGWVFERSIAAPWFHQPGGGTQFRIIRPDGTTGSVRELEQFGFLRRIR